MVVSSLNKLLQTNEKEAWLQQRSHTCLKVWVCHLFTHKINLFQQNQL